MKNLTKICCLLLNLSFCAYAEEAQVIDLKIESQVVNPQVNEASSQTSPYQNLIKDYTYKVPFLGDLDAAYQDTFNLLVKDLSNGAMSGNDLSVDISSLILSENIGDDFIETCQKDPYIHSMIYFGDEKYHIPTIVARPDSFDRFGFDPFLLQIRNDAFINANALESTKKFPELKFQKIVMEAPTVDEYGNSKPVYERYAKEKAKQELEIEKQNG